MASDFEARLEKDMGTFGEEMKDKGSQNISSLSGAAQLLQKLTDSQPLTVRDLILANQTESFL